MDPNVQDWKPVVLTKKPKAKRTGPAPSSTPKSLNDFDPASAHSVTTSNHSLGVALQQARAAKGWKQAELDQKCNLPKGTTQRYENGSAVYKPSEVNKMARLLGVNLPRPKKKKSKSKTDK